MDRDGGARCGMLGGLRVRCCVWSRSGWAPFLIRTISRSMPVDERCECNLFCAALFHSNFHFFFTPIFFSFLGGTAALADSIKKRQLHFPKLWEKRSMLMNRFFQTCVSLERPWMGGANAFSSARRACAWLVADGITHEHVAFFRRLVFNST